MVERLALPTQARVIFSLCRIIAPLSRVPWWQTKSSFLIKSIQKWISECMLNDGSFLSMLGEFNFLLLSHCFRCCGSGSLRQHGTDGIFWVWEWWGQDQDSMNTVCAYTEVRKTLPLAVWCMDWTMKNSHLLLHIVPHLPVSLFFFFTSFINN